MYYHCIVNNLTCLTIFAYDKLDKAAISTGFIADSYYLK